MQDLKAFTAGILSDLSALPEKKMRLGLLGRVLSSLDPEDAARLVDSIYRSGPEDISAQRARAVLADNDGIRETIGAPAYRAIYLASIKLDLTKVSRLFTDLPPHKKGPFGYDQEEDIQMEHTTLGQRRALSKQPVQKTLERLLSDPDPMVIGNLLNNPRITEKEVLKIASKRPNSAQILKLIALHGKWSKRYAVAKAIALNPYAPPRTSIAFLDSMMEQDLKMMAEDKTLHPQVKQAAKEILEDKGKNKKGP